MIGAMHQKYRDLEPVITNVMHYDTCVMVDALRTYLPLEKKKTNMVTTVVHGRGSDT